MSKKEFVAVAAAIKLSVEQIRNSYSGFNNPELPDALTGVRATAINLANAFSDLNPRFDRELFLAACGVN